MVIAHGERNGRKLLLLGLSQGNVRRLMNDEPVHLTPETHPGCPDGMEVLIVYGATETTIAEQLRALGAVDSDTKVIAVVSPPKGHQ